MIRDRRSVCRSAGRLVLLALTLLPSLVLAQDADHLLISEVVALTRNPVSTFGSPFIEVTNPTDAAIDLDDVYLSTAQDVALDKLYWNIVTGADQGGGTSGNVHCRFPAGLSLEAGESLVIAINGSEEFEDAYGYMPHLELYEDGLAPDTVAEMREAFPGGIGAGLGNGGNNVPELSNGSGAADSIILYRWDGETDLVTDIDYLAYGSSTNVRVDKTGVAVDGPDADDGTSNYTADTAVASQSVVASLHTFGQALTRVGVVETAEVQSGGNGVGGDDETSEDLATSWQVAGAQDPAAAPASYYPAAPIITTGTIGEAFAGYPVDLSLTAFAADGVGAMAAHYRINGGAWQEVAGSDQGDGLWLATIPALPGNSSVEYYGTMTSTAGGTAVWPAGGDHLSPVLEVEGVPAPEITSAVAGTAFENTDCTVTVNVDAVDQNLTGTLFWDIDGDTYGYTDVAMDHADGLLTGAIPGQPNGVVVNWYVEVVDSSEQSDIFPEGAPETVLSLTFTNAVTGAAKLLITEVNTGQNVYPYTSMVQIAPEFVEVYNPNEFAVDMSDYYLTDAINYYFSTQLYWYITQGTPTQQTVGGGHYNDFTARFPAGFVLEPETAVVVSLASSGWFERIYSRLPDIELYEDEESVDGVPEMRPVFENPAGEPEGDSIFSPGRDDGGSSDELPKGIPELEEYYGEPLVLYHWTEGAATVTDIDIFMMGDEKTGNYRYGFDKSEEPGYQPDTPVADQMWFEDLDNTGSLSYTRIDAEEGQQLATGSNGVGGRDETSEDWPLTFELAYPTPGVFMAGLDSAGDVSLSVPARTFLPLLGESFPISIVSLGGAETRLRILDLEGRVVVQLWDSRFDGEVSSFNEFPTIVTWDGRDETFDRVRAGMYVVHLQAVDPLTGDRYEETAPVVVATRLD